MTPTVFTAHLGACRAEEDSDEAEAIPTVDEDLGKSKEGSRTDDEVVDRWATLGRLERNQYWSVASFCTWCLTSRSIFCFTERKRQLRYVRMQNVSRCGVRFVCMRYLHLLGPSLDGEMAEVIDLSFPNYSLWWRQCGIVHRLVAGLCQAKPHISWGRWSWRQNGLQWDLVWWK